MNKIIQAHFENGIFRPVGITGIPDPCDVELEVRIVQPAPSDDSVDDGMDAIYAILSKRFNSGEHDGAERHNEHQP